MPDPARQTLLTTGPGRRTGRSTAPRLTDDGAQIAPRTTTQGTGRGVTRGHVVVAADLLRGRLAQPWTLGALAEEVHLSRSQLVRAFDATVGTSPMAYLRQMRVEQMARLLSSTDLSIAETARLVGWTDPPYASRCFHQHFGLSPTDFRRRAHPSPNNDRGEPNS
jgi:transcriptional regulator GlxA family with amidase domain